MMFRPLGSWNEELIVADWQPVYAFDPLAMPIELRALSHLPDDYEDFRLVDSRVYWLEAGGDSEIRILWADVGGGAATEVGRYAGQISSGPLVNRDVALLAPEMLVSEPVNLEQHFVMFSVDDDCVTELPGLGTSIGSQIIDDTHVYWKSFNALEGVSDGDDLNEGVPYVRVDLRSGVLERLVSDSFTVSLITDILAQDAEAIYFRNNDDGSLVALYKP